LFNVDVSSGQAVDHMTCSQLVAGRAFFVKVRCKEG